MSQVDQGLNMQVPLPGGRKLGFSGGLYNRIVASATHFMQVRGNTCDTLTLLNSTTLDPMVCCGHWSWAAALTAYVPMHVQLLNILPYAALFFPLEKILSSIQLTA